MSSYEEDLKYATELFESGKFEEAFSEAQELVNIDEKRIEGYLLSIKSAIELEDYIGGLIGCVEGLDKHPNSKELQDLYTIVAKKRKEKEEAPIIANEAVAPTSPIWTTTTDDSISGLVATPTHVIITSESGDYKITTVEAIQKKDFVAEGKVKSPINCLAVSPCNSHFAIGTQDGTLRVCFDFASSRELKELPIGAKRSWLENIIWFVHNDKQFISFSIAKDVYVVEANIPSKELTLLQKLEDHEVTVQGVHWSGSKWGLVSLSNKKFNTWNLESTEPTNSYGFEGIVTSFAVGGPDGDIVFIGLRSGHTFAWDMEKFKRDRGILCLPKPERGSTDISSSVALDPKSTYLASGISSGDVLVYALKSRLKNVGLSATFRGHRKNVLSLAPHPFGPFLASGCENGTIYIWNLSNNDPVAKARCMVTGVDSNNNNGVRKLAWTNNGTMLVAGYCDGTIAFFQS